MVLQNVIAKENKAYEEVAYGIVRIGFGLALMYHGWDKINSFNTYVADFPAPLGLSAQTSLCLAIFAEFFCGFLVVAGLMTRVACLPIFATFFIASFVVHAGDPFQARELALVYLFFSAYCLVRGSGHVSFDRKLFVK